MILQNGKFFENGVPVPLEFGNVEQIKLMKEAEKRLALMTGEGMPIDVWIEASYEANTKFKCISCSKPVFVSRSVDDERDKSDMIGDCACNWCKEKYVISKNNEGDFIVKKK